MLLTISTTSLPGGAPATDLGFLLHKHPDRVQHFDQSFGRVTIVYPEATAERCTAAMVLDIDPVRVARSRGKREPDRTLAQYVNDRPYAASSLVAVALGDVFSTARAGVCNARPDLVDQPLPLTLHLPAVPCRGGSDVVARIFEPLGWTIEATPIPLDPTVPAWGDSQYLSLTLTGEVRLADALNQLYVLLPALDESKHYWQDSDEVDKLVRVGGDWLANHPDRDLITRRYLRQTHLVRAALARLAELGDDSEDDLDPEADDTLTAAETERRVPLNQQRHEAVVQTLRDLGATSVIDLGCGPGALLATLRKERQLTRITGTDVSSVSLTQAERRLRLDRASARDLERLTLFQAALTYQDERFAGYDAAVLMEVIEHVDESRLAALAQVVFGAARPTAVIVTTPNVEYNVNYPGLVGARHRDHRFEWTRAEFAAWCARVAAEYGYEVAVSGIGEVDEATGQPTQLGVFRRD